MTGTRNLDDAGLWVQALSQPSLDLDWTGGRPMLQAFGARCVHRAPWEGQQMRRASNEALPVDSEDTAQDPPWWFR